MEYFEANWQPDIETAIRETSRKFWRQNYQDYLRTDWWRQLKTLVNSREDRTCQECGLRGGPKWQFHVHHLTYERFPFRELPVDLQLLCDRCHKSEHGLA